MPGIDGLGSCSGIASIGSAPRASHFLNQTIKGCYSAPQLLGSGFSAADREHRSGEPTRIAAL
jgi:hypothetical protein